MKKLHEPSLIWITGFSAAGKTTVARKLVAELRNDFSNVIHFDGDDLRNIFGNTWGYKANDRVALARVYFSLCNFIISQGNVVVISAIGMFNETEDWIKDNIPLSLIVELKVPENDRLLRDSNTKKIYKKGKVFDADYDVLNQVDLHIDNFGDNSVEDVVKTIINKFDNKSEKNTDHGRSHHWKDYYKSNTAPQNCSSFAEYVHKNIVDSNFQSVLDIGCGNGRDSFYFSNNNLDVTAIDYSMEAIESCKNNDHLNKIKFYSGKIDDISELYSSKYDCIYSRFVLHAMPLKEEKIVINESFQMLNDGGKFYIECRSTEDPLFRKGEVISSNERSEGHYRRFIDFNELKSRLIDAGFDIEESIESNGLAIYKDDDPVVIRIIAKKK